MRPQPELSTTMIPRKSYTIWFTQRTGSTWLCEALASTGVAGRPGEHLNRESAADALKHYKARDRDELLQRVYELGSTPNGVFGIKQGYSESRFSSIIDLVAPGSGSRLARWEAAFPNHHHVFMTRRNKLRLAVSWWRAIKTGEWHRRRGELPAAHDLTDAYDAIAIDHLMQDAVVREAGIQEMFTEARIAPLQIAYEDLQLDLASAVNAILHALDLPPAEIDATRLDLKPTADDLTESWVQRFRTDRQAGWDNPSW